MKQTIGIIGGADPAASCLLYKKIIDACLKRPDCKNGGDFPEIIIINFPFSRAMQATDAQKKELSLVDQLQYATDKLVGDGATIIALACNTLHAFISKVALSTATLVHLPELTMEYLQKSNAGKTLILATETTMKSGLFRNTDHCQLCRPEQKNQQIIDTLIAKIHTNRFDASDMKKLVMIITKEHARSPFDTIVYGCTDLPVLEDIYPIANHGLPTTIRVINPLQLLADNLVIRSFGKC